MKRTILALGLVAALAACGGGDDDPSVQAEPTSSASSAAPTPTPTATLSVGEKLACSRFEPAYNDANDYIAEVTGPGAKPVAPFIVEANLGRLTKSLDEAATGAPAGDLADNMAAAAGAYADLARLINQDAPDGQTQYDLFSQAAAEAIAACTAAA